MSKYLLSAAAAAFLMVGGSSGAMADDHTFTGAEFCTSIADSLDSGKCHANWTYTLAGSDDDELDEEGWGQLRTGNYEWRDGNCRELAERTTTSTYLATNPGGNDVPAQDLTVDSTEQKWLGTNPANCS